MAQKDFGSLLQTVSVQATRPTQDDTTRRTSLAGLNLPSSVTTGVTNRLDGDSQVVRITSSGTDQGLVGTNQNVLEFTPPNTANKVPRVYGYVSLGGTIIDTHKANANTIFVCTVLSEFDTDRFDGTDTGDRAIRTISRDGRVLADRTTPFSGNYVTGDGSTFGNSGLLDPNTNTIEYSWGSNSSSNPLNVWVYAGSSDSANLIAKTYTGTNPNAYDVFPTWTSSNTMDNLLFAIIRVDFYEDEPADFKIDSFGTWRFEVMMRFGETNSMPVGSGGANVTPDFQNPAHILYDYLTSDRYGAGLAAADIDADSIYDWYTECHSNQIYYGDVYNDYVITERTHSGAASGYYRRFANLGYVVDPQLPVVENIKAICQAGMATLNYNYKTGKFGVNMTRAFTGFGGSYEGYDRFDFNKNNVLGEIAIATTDLYSLFNFNECTFPNYAGRYMSDTVITTTPVADKVSNEVTSGMSISLPAVTWRPQAADIANITLKQSRVDQVVTLTGDHSTLTVDVGDFVTLTDESKGIDGDVYRVKRIVEKNDTAAVTVNFIMEQCLTTPFIEVAYDNTVNDPFATGIGFNSNFPGSSDFSDPVAEYQSEVANIIVLYNPINGNGDGNIINPATGSITGVWNPATANLPPGDFTDIDEANDPWISIDTDYDYPPDPVEINKVVITGEYSGDIGNPVAEVIQKIEVGAGAFLDADSWQTMRGDKFTTGNYRFTCQLFQEQKHIPSLNVPITLPTKPTLISSITAEIYVDMTDRCLGNTMIDTYGTNTQIVQTVSNVNLGTSNQDLYTPLQHDIIGAAIGEYDVSLNFTPQWGSILTSQARYTVAMQGDITFANNANNASELFQFNGGGVSVSGNAEVMANSNIEGNVQTLTSKINTDPRHYGLDPEVYFASRCNVVLRGSHANISSPQATDIDYDITNKSPYYRSYA